MTRGLTAWRRWQRWAKMTVWVAVAVLFPLFAVSPKIGPTLQNIPLVLYACLLASMVAPPAWMQAVVRLGPSRTTLFFNLLPLITALIAGGVEGRVGVVSLGGWIADVGRGDFVGALDHAGQDRLDAVQNVGPSRPATRLRPSVFGHAR